MCGTVSGIAERAGRHERADPLVVVVQLIAQHLGEVLVALRRTLVLGARRAHAHRGARVAHGPVQRVVGLDDQPARDRVLLLERLADGVDRPARDAGRVEVGEPRLRRAGVEDLLQLGEQGDLVALARGEGAVLLAVGPLRVPEDRGQPLPELLLGAAHDDPGVGGLEDLERHQRRVRGVAGAVRGEVGVERPDPGVGEHRDRGVVQRHVAVHADAVAPRGVDAGQQRDRRDHAAGVVDHRQAGLGGRAVGLAGDVHPAAEALQDVVVAGLLAPRPGHPEARQRAAHDGRVEVLEVVVGDLDLLGHVAAQVAVDRVGLAHEVLEDRAALGGGQVERQRALVAVEDLEEQRVLALGVRGHVAAHVAARRRLLDLDHLGAEVGEVHASPGAGAVLLDGDDADVLQRQTLGHAGFPSVRSPISVDHRGLGGPGLVRREAVGRRGELDAVDDAVVRGQPARAPRPGCRTA